MTALSPENQKIWNLLGLLDRNGNVTLSVERFGEALNAARSEGRKELETALAFYRDEWTVPAIGPRNDSEPTIRLLNDQGRRAQAALLPREGSR